MYPLFESIRINNKEPQYLNFHQKRMDDSFKMLYEKDCPFLLDKVLAHTEFPSGVVKLRFLYNHSNYYIEYASYVPKRVETLQLVYSNTIEYSLKYTNRQHLNKLWHQKGNCDDILIIKNGLITDTSFSNIVFFDEKQWYTPSTPLLNGTCRQRLLSVGFIKECNLSPSGIQFFKSFKLINAMLNWNEQQEITISKIQI